MIATLFVPLKLFVLQSLPGERYINSRAVVFIMGKEKTEEVYTHGGKIAWIRLKHSGLYDLEALLGAARGWFFGHKYYIIDNEHSEGVKSGGKEIRVLWTAMRDVTEYIRFKVEFEVMVLREIDVLVEENGKKTKKQQGDLEIRFRASIMKNYRKTFHGAGKEFMRQMYEKYLIRRELKGYEDKLTNEGNELWEAMKGVLGSFKT